VLAKAATLCAKDGLMEQGVVTLVIEHAIELLRGRACIKLNCQTGWLSEFTMRWCWRSADASNRPTAHAYREQPCCV
jgi:hypothetical protein